MCICVAISFYWNSKIASVSVTYTLALLRIKTLYMMRICFASFALYPNPMLHFAVFFEPKSCEGASTTTTGAYSQRNSCSFACCIPSICWKGRIFSPYVLCLAYHFLWASLLNDFMMHGSGFSYPWQSRNRNWESSSHCMQMPTFCSK